MRQEINGWRKHLDFIALDVICLHLAYALAYCLRFGWGDPYAGREWCILIIVMSLFDMLVMVFGGTLQGVLRRGHVKEAVSLVKQILALELLSIFFLFLVHEGESYSRVVVLLTGGFHLLFSFAVRFGWKKLLKEHFHRQKYRVLLVGSSELACRYALELQKSVELRSAEIIAYLAEHPCPDIPDYAGGIDRLESYLIQNAADEVVLAPSLEEESELIHIVELCEKYGVRIQVIPFYNDVISSNPRISALGDVKLLNFRATPLDEMTNAIIKRSIDIVGSFVLIILTSPIMLFAAIGTRLSSPGPVLFRQERVGRGKKTFKMLKFRSMIPNAEERLEELLDQNEMDGPVFKIKDDPRITRVGRFLRKTSIDELPQLLNILKGDMSIVGPRPALPREVEQYSDYEKQRLYVTPGLTCFWQIQPNRNDLSFAEWMDLDLKYVQERSFTTDWKIIFKTVGAVLGMNGE